MTETFKDIQNETSSNDERMIDFRRLFKLLWRWLWLILLAGLIAGAAGYVLSHRIKPVYETSTSLLVFDPTAPNLANSNSIQGSELLTRTYSEMLTNQAVLQDVIGKLNLSASAYALSQSIKVTPVRNTQLLEITVQGTDPEQIASIANTLVDSFINRLITLQSDHSADARKSYGDLLNQANKSIQDTKNQIDNASSQADKDRLSATLAQYQQAYAILLSNYQQARYADAQFSANAVQLNKAQPPSSPISPNVKRNALLSSILAMVLAAGMIFGLDALDDTVKSPEQIRSITNLPILGVISRQKKGMLPITPAELHSPVSEAFWTLRANIQYANMDKPLRTLMVTSPSPMEGKTTVSMNLAVLFAHSSAYASNEEKVILLDADLRHPQIHQYFGIDNQVGIASILLAPVPYLNGSLKKTSFQSLSVLPAGEVSTNPVELLGSQKMRQLIDQLKDQADMVIIDTPPVLPVADALALSTESDGVLLVVRPGITKLKEAQEAIERLRQVHARIIGLVINDADSKSQSSHYSFYFDKDYRTKTGSLLHELGNRVSQDTHQRITKLKLSPSQWSNKKKVISFVGIRSDKDSKPNRLRAWSSITRSSRNKR